MKNIVILSCLLFAVFMLNACQTTDLNLGTDTALPTAHTPLRASPVDVMNDYITTQALEPQAISVAQGNLFSNGGFESGLDGWTGCAAGAITTSTSAYEGTGALKVNTGNCFYRSAEVSAGQDLMLSCYVRLESGSAWTGMGMGFSDASWTPISDAPTTVITGSSYARYDVRAVAPAGSKYASMWLYSDNPALVDNCSLMLESTPPPPPPPSTGENLLENGGFGFRDFSQTPTIPLDWTAGCGGEVSITNGVINRLGRGVNLRNGACIDQGLSASDIAEISGQAFTYSCLARNNGGYASMSIFLDGQPISKAIPESQYYQLVQIQATAGQISNGFVSLYSEGNLSLDECGVARGTVGFEQLPVIEVRNGSQGTETVDSAESRVVRVQVKNSGNVLLTSLSASSDTLDCSINSADVQPGQIVTFDCTTPALASGQTFTNTITATGTTAAGATVTATDGYKQINTGSTPPPSGNNLLENGLIEENSSPSAPDDWTVGCGGSFRIVTVGAGNSIAELTNGACMDQPLSSSDLSVLAGQEYTLSCTVRNISGSYASMSIFFDGAPVTTVLSQGGGAIRAEVTGIAPTASSGFVSIYSSGTLTVDDCKLLLGSPPPPPPPSDNLLENGLFEENSNPSAPDDWIVGCGGSFRIVTVGAGNSLAELSNGACMEQALSSTDLSLLRTRAYTFSCTFRNISGSYASMSTYFDGTPVTTVLSQESGAVRAEVTGFGPNSPSSGFVSIYSDGTLTVDDCQLVY